MPFQDSLKDLKALVSLLQLKDHWIDEVPLQSFSTESGEQINVWPASSDLQVKGHPKASRDLEAPLEPAMANQGT
jgi:hypothetical protein